ncbi:MAG: bifunctional DNA primase/polymerase [Betaproteobacteria bacterium]|nr:bifunctional DNA primase/polymerase [Betaproteobacteria bacterium]
MAIFPVHEPLPDGSCSCRKADCSKPGKHPRTRNGLKAATTSEEQIRRWWQTAPSANIGLPCGAVNSVVVLDVDGAAGVESLQRLTDQNGPLPATRKDRDREGLPALFPVPRSQDQNRGADQPRLSGIGLPGRRRLCRRATEPALHGRLTPSTGSPRRRSPRRRRGWSNSSTVARREPGAGVTVAANDEHYGEGTQQHVGQSGGVDAQVRHDAEAIEAALLMANQQRSAIRRWRRMKCAISRAASPGTRRVHRTTSFAL